MKTETIFIYLQKVLNWKYSLREWRIGFGVFIISALVAIFWLGQVQEEFLSAPYKDMVDPDLVELGKQWRNFSLLFFSLTLLSGLVYIYSLIKAYSINLINLKTSV